MLYVLYNNRAVMRVGQKNFDEAGTDLKLAIKLKPDQYQAYASLAQVEFLQGRSGEAVAAMDQAVKAALALVDRGAIDPPMLGLLYRTRSRFQLGRSDVPAALDDLDRAVAVEATDSPALPALQAERGRLLHRLQQYSEAIRRLFRGVASVEAEPGHPPLDGGSAGGGAALSRGGRRLCTNSPAAAARSPSRIISCWPWRTTRPATCAAPSTI